jgi:pyruvate kinase
MPITDPRSAAGAVLADLERIRHACLSEEKAFASSIDDACVQSKESMRNLLHYLALRRHDLRELQPKLASMGLSSLGRTESSTLAGLDAVIAALEVLSGTVLGCIPQNGDFETGPARLRKNAEHLLGPVPKGRAVRIMVTMPTEAAYSCEFTKNLIAAGTDVVRINCAHDSREEWGRMVENVQNANRELGRTCKILMDLAGPKLLTGTLSHGYHVIRWRISKDVGGSIVQPARIALVIRDTPANINADAILPVPQALVRTAEPGDVIRFKDSRNKKRKLTVTEKHANACICSCSQGAYVLNGTILTLFREARVIAKGRIYDLPFVEEPFRLKPKDLLVLTNPQSSHAVVSHGSKNSHDGCTVTSAEAALLYSRSQEPVSPTWGKHNAPQISCTLPEAFACAKPGEPIFFDDGKIEGVIREVHPDHMLVEIVRASVNGTKLGSGKGINLPETDLSIPAITDKDLDDLDFVVQHAGLVGLSFVRRPEDVLKLHEELAKRNKARLGIVLKIESRQAFEHLPLIIIAALRQPPVGIMVARGDLAIEVGFDRLAEVQEEILWLSEAAHLPVIWATQVLENLAKTGMPSRAEVTDAAMSVRAECVMLNKGQYIAEAVHFLDNILHRMQAHQHKKRSMLRRLAVADFAHA